MHIKNQSNTRIIGVSGHRDLLEKDWNVGLLPNGELLVEGALLAFVETQLKALEQETPHQRLLLLSGMAEGADLLVCYVARRLKIEYIAVLPFEQETYLQKFETEPQKQLFKELLQTAEAVEVVSKSEESKSEESKKKEDAAYLAVGREIARHSDEMLALWNGVDTGLRGGTWEVVTMARTGKDADGRSIGCMRDKKRQCFRLHHLLTPRRRRPYPIPRFFESTTLSALLPLGAAYTWVTLAPNLYGEPSGWQKVWKSFVNYRYTFFKYVVTLLLFLFTVIVGGVGIYNFVNHPDHQNIKDVHHLAWWEAVYKAFKFSALIPPTYDAEASHFSTWYVWGKVAGWVLFMYSASIAVLMLMGDAARRWAVRWIYGRFWGFIRVFVGVVWFFVLLFKLPPRLDFDSLNLLQQPFVWAWVGYVLVCIVLHFTQRYWDGLWLDFNGCWKQKWDWDWRPFKYNLVLGLNDKSYDVVHDLRLRGEGVVVLEADHHSGHFEESQKEFAVVIADDPTETHRLHDVGFKRAKEVYILGDDDSQNLHLVQQMDRLLVEDNATQARSTWYVHVKDPSKRQFLNRFTHQLPQVSIYSFNLYENIARRLLVQYPIDRFYHDTPTDTSHVFIFGFEDIGREILMACLKMGHFGKGQRLHIRVFADAAAEQEAAFRNGLSFGIASSEQAVATPTDAYRAAFATPLGRELIEEVFGHVTLDFYDFPQNDFELLNDAFPLYEALQPNGMVSVYFTQADELASVARLSSLLERLQVLHLQQPQPCDVQVFCYYNFPSESETALVERRLNELAPDIPVVCFGNFVQECSATCLRDRALDQIPQLVALYYTEVIDKKESWDTAEREAIIARAAANWRKTKEMDKESNRLFADHAFVKMRMVWAQMAMAEKQSTTSATMLIASELREWLQGKKHHYEAIADLEHRRWCAEKLLDGWTPLLTDPEEVDKNVKHWKNDKPFKALARSQKRHLDLVPTARLAQIEVAKDTQLIEGIAKILEVVGGIT